MRNLVLAAAAMSMTAAVAAPSPPTATATTQAESIQSMASTVESDVKTMPHFWASSSFGELRCPDHAPYLEDRTYSAGVPAGIEVRTFGGDGVHVFSVPVYHASQRGQIGFAFATVTNWAVPDASRSVQFVAHCVTR